MSFSVLNIFIVVIIMIMIMIIINIIIITIVINQFYLKHPFTWFFVQILPKIIKNNINIYIYIYIYIYI